MGDITEPETQGAASGKKKKKEREREKEMGRNKDFLRKQNMRYRKKKSRDKGEEARRKGALGEY